MFIQTEDTPNPETLKFLPGQVVMSTGTAFYPSVESCKNSSFAKRLFAIDGVAGVFFGADFITITKKTDLDWYVLKPSILGVIMEHFVANLPVIEQSLPTDVDASHANDPIVVQIKELLDTRIRPAVAQDGGDIMFHAFKDGIVYLHMQGACSGCPSSQATLKSGIENMLKYYVPEILEVQAIA